MRCDRITLLNRIFRSVLKATYLYAQYIILINISCCFKKCIWLNFKMKAQIIDTHSCVDLYREHEAYRLWLIDAHVVIMTASRLIPDTMLEWYGETVLKWIIISVRSSCVALFDSSEVHLRITLYCVYITSIFICYVTIFWTFILWFHLHIAYISIL